MANIFDQFDEAQARSGNVFDQFDAPAKEVEGGFAASVKSGIGSAIKGAGQAAADFIPGVGKDNAVKRYGQEVIDANPTAVHSLEDIASKPGKAIAEAVGNAGGSVAQMLGARAVGTGVTMLAPFTGPAAPVVAGIGQAIAWFGPAAVAALPSYSGIRDKQVLNDPEANESWKAKAVATLGAAAVGAIETKFGPQEWALSALTKEGRSKLAEKFAATTIGGSVIKAAGKGALVEGAEELAQNPIEQAAAYDDPTSAASVKDTLFGAAMGAIGGGVVGGGFGIAGRTQPKADPIPEILDAPDVDSAINAASAALALPAPGANTGETILASERGVAGTAAQFDALRRPTDINETGAFGQGRNSDITDVVAKPIPAPVANDPAALLDRQAIGGDPLQPILQARTERTAAAEQVAAEAEARKAAEMEAIPGLASEQDTVQAAVERAASLETPTAMQLALQKARGVTAPAVEAAPVQPAAPALPRVVERTEGMVALPQKLAEQRAAANPELEVVRFANIDRATGEPNGKYAFSVAPKVADVGASGVPAGVRADGASGRAVDTGRDGNQPTGSAVPLATWVGRRGDGYVTREDASMALPSRQRVEPDLSWKIEQMPTGKFRLAGYESAAVKSGDGTSVQPGNGIVQSVLGEQNADVQGRDGREVSAVLPGDGGRGPARVEGLPKPGAVGEGQARTAVPANGQAVISNSSGVPEGAEAAADRPNAVGRLAQSPSNESAQTQATQAATSDTLPAPAGKAAQAAAGRGEGAGAAASPDVPVKQAVQDSARAEAILDAANVRGKERLEAIKDIRSGAITVDELQRAHPKPEAKPTTGEGSDSAMAAMVKQREAKPKASTLDGNPFKTFLIRRGIALRMARDFAPGTRERLSMGRTFRGDGLELDQLAEFAAEEGYIRDRSDTDELYDLIAKVANGERVGPMYGQDGEGEMSARLDRQRQAEEDAAADVAELSVASLLALDDDSDIPWDSPASTVTTEQFLRALGASEQEIRDEAENEQRRAREAGEGRSKSVESGAREAQADSRRRDEAARTEERLTSPTRESILARQDRAAQAERDERAADKAADDKARNERESRDIAARQDSSAENFELGQSAEDSLSGQNKLFTEGKGRPFTAYRQFKGQHGIDFAKNDAEKVLGFKSPVPVMKKADQALADKGVPMYYDLDAKVIVYNSAFKDRDRAKDAQWMAEEILHAVDHAGGASTISLSSDMLQPGGELRTEVEKAVGRSGTLKDFLRYPLDMPELSEDRKTVELFARLGVVFKGFPELLQATAPKTYEVYRAIFAPDVQREVPRSADAGANRQADQRLPDVGGSGQATGRSGGVGQADSQLDGLRARIAGALQGSVTGVAGDFGGSTLETRATIAGQTNRQYSAEQKRAMRNVGFEVDEKTLKERAQALWQDAGKKLAQGIVDQFAPIKDLSKEAYALMRLSKGATGAFESFLRGGQLKLTDGVYDFDDTKRGGVVDKLLIPLQGEHHDFFRWIAANRAERLKTEGKEHLFSDQDIADLKTLASGTTAFDYTIQTGPQAGQVTRDRTKVYADSQRVFNEFNKNILDMAEQSGLIDGASRKLWEHEFYVPFYRVADDADGGVRGMNIKGGVVRQQAFKQLKGGKNALNADLLDNTLMNWAHLLDAAAKNRGAKATLEAAERMGVAISAPQYTANQIGAATGNKNGVTWFMDGGQKRFFVVDDPFVLTAINSLEYAGMRNPVMNAMSYFKHALTVGVTASPFFKVRNLIRDSVQVIGTSGINVNPLANVAEGWKLTDPKSDAYFQLLAGGGTIHFGTMLEGSEAKRVQRLVESGIDDATILNNDNKVKAFYRSFIEPGINAYNELGNRGEAVNRAALYAQLKAQGMNHAEASLQARDLMDFSMQGSFTSIRFLTQVVPFANARLQGMYKLGRSAKENPARFSAVIGASALISLSLLAMYHDDDDWKKREDWDRNNFWWFRFGGTAFRIPKPFEIGAIATLAERGFELAFEKEMTGKRFRQQVMTLLGDNLSMNPVPQLVKPIMEVYSNKNSFNDRPIESMGMERLKSEYRFNDRTSMTARAASTTLNSITGLVGKEALSPVQIDHMLRGYFGWLGSFIVGAGDVVMRPATGQATHPAPDYWKTATGSMVSDLRDAPSRYVSQMYDQAKEIEQAYGTWRAMLKEGKTAEAKEFAEDHKADLSKYRKVETIKRAEAKFNERIRMIERSNIKPEEKRDLIRTIRDQQDRVARLAA